jgi:hypothetical protein
MTGPSTAAWVTAMRGSAVVSAPTTPPPMSFITVPRLVQARLLPQEALMQ